MINNAMNQHKNDDLSFELYIEKNKQILIQHQIDLYDQFVDEVIPNMLRCQNIISEVDETKTVKYRRNPHNESKKVDIVKK